MVEGGGRRSPNADHLPHWMSDSGNGTASTAASTEETDDETEGSLPDVGSNMMLFESLRVTPPPAAAAPRSPPTARPPLNAHDFAVPASPLLIGSPILAPPRPQQHTPPQHTPPQHKAHAHEPVGAESPLLIGSPQHLSIPVAVEAEPPPPARPVPPPTAPPAARLVPVPPAGPPPAGQPRRAAGCCLPVVPVHAGTAPAVVRSVRRVSDTMGAAPAPSSEAFGRPAGPPESESLPLFRDGDTGRQSADEFSLSPAATSPLALRADFTDASPLTSENASPLKSSHAAQAESEAEAEPAWLTEASQAASGGRPAGPPEPDSLLLRDGDRGRRSADELALSPAASSPLPLRADSTDASPRASERVSPLRSSLAGPGKEGAAESEAEDEPAWLRKASEVLELTPMALPPGEREYSSAARTRSDAPPLSDDSPTAWPSEFTRGIGPRDAPDSPALRDRPQSVQTVDLDAPGGQYEYERPTGAITPEDQSLDGATAAQALADQALFFGVPLDEAPASHSPPAARAPATSLAPPPASPAPSSPAYTCSESAASTVPLGEQMPPARMSAKAWGKLTVQAAAAANGAAANGTAAASAVCSAAAPTAGETSAGARAPKQPAFEGLTPQQRAALIDQATFFGMDLKRAMDDVLGGGVGGAAARPQPSAASSAAPPLLPPRAGGSAASAASKQHRRPDAGAGDWTGDDLGSAPQLRAAACQPSASSSATPVDWASSSSDVVNSKDPLSRALNLSTRVLLQLAQRLWAMAPTQPTRRGIPYRLLLYLCRRAVRLAEALEVFATRADEVLSAMAVRMAAQLEVLAAVMGLAIFRALLKVADSSVRRAHGAISPYASAAAKHGLGALDVVRRYRVGRHVSNGAGAVLSLMLARMAVLGGPILGAMIYAPLEYGWFLVGLNDIRIFVPVGFAMLGALLRFYAYLGLLD